MAAAVLATAGIAVAMPGARAAEPATPYFQIGAGINFQESQKFDTSSGGTTQSSLNFDPGPIVTGSAGYAFGNNWRAEFEIGYRDMPGNDITLPGGGTTPSGSVKGGAEVYTYMANGYYDFDLTSMPRWHPHIGFGVGLANVNFSRVAAESTFAYQAIAGVQYEIQPRLRVGIDYRYLGSDSIHQTFTAPGLASRGLSGNIEDHAILFTLRWNIFAP